jgi:hypothetical protein
LGPACLPASLSVCLPACLSVCLPACLINKKNINNKTHGNTTTVKATPNKNQNTCMFMVKEKTKKLLYNMCKPTRF